MLDVAGCPPQDHDEDFSHPSSHLIHIFKIAGRLDALLPCIVAEAKSRGAELISLHLDQFENMHGGRALLAGISAAEARALSARLADYPGVTGVSVEHLLRRLRASTRATR